MSITRIQIDNFRSIKHCVLNFDNINLLIGENGTGKSNILDAVRHFYACLLQENDSADCYNFQNRFSNEFSISLTFDFRHLKQISGNNRQRDTDSNYEGYYKWISGRRQSETLTLRQINGKAARWNQNRRYRQNILNLFPLYAVDARQVDLTDWSQLWDIIGDLMKVHRAREAEIAAEISSIKDNEKYKLEERFTKLLESLDRANIQIKAYTPKQYASTISTLLCKGDVFSFKDSKLDYMSNGTNAFNYTNLLIEILKLIFVYKIKEPVVILDEPEISLHHKLIDRLTERILGCHDAIRFLIATHSPRLLKNILKLEQSNCMIIHVSQTNGHTHTAAVTLFSQDSDQRLRIFMTDQHANAYFSRYILSVEGASENEVFSNRYLQALFPFLRDVDIMEGMSDDVVQRIISPEYRHFQTQFLLLADMDKFLVRSGDNTHFELRGKYFPGKELPREWYYYSRLRSEQLLRLKRIRALAEQGRFRFWMPFYSCKDPNFRELLRLIQEYLLRRNLFAASTTVEGMLITYSNFPSFLEYCREAGIFSRNQAGLDSAYSGMLRNDRLNLTRLLVSGKSDFLFNLDEICKRNTGFDPKLKSLIESSRQGKTGGWISGWLEYFFRKSARSYGIPCKTFSQFAEAAEDQDLRFFLRRDVWNSFPELFDLLEIIRQQMSGRSGERAWAPADVRASYR